MFKATSQNGKLELHGLETFIEKKFAEFRKALGLAAGARRGKKAKRPAKKSARKPAPVKAATPLEQLLMVLSSHPKGAALAEAGKQKDQLLRSLIPLYLARGLDGVEISSGTTSKFWARHGVKFAAPNAAKALREHVGYARRTAKGMRITPNGIKYVEAALSGKKRAA